jgi:hypothetical protein
LPRPVASLAAVLMIARVTVFDTAYLLENNFLFRS